MSSSSKSRRSFDSQLAPSCPPPDAGDSRRVPRAVAALAARICEDEAYHTEGVAWFWPDSQKIFVPGSDSASNGNRSTVVILPQREERTSKAASMTIRLQEDLS